MNNTNAQIADQIFQLIQKSTTILLHLHVSPDPDSYGSNLALAEYLTSLKKNVTLLQGDSPALATLARLPGYDTIVKKTINEVDLESYDLIISLDTSSILRITTEKSILEKYSGKIINIDHHEDNTIPAVAKIVETTYGSVCEILYELLTLWGAPISRSMALNLVCGIWSDTVGLTTKEATKTTYAIVGNLGDRYPGILQEVHEILRGRTKEEVRFVGFMCSRVEEFFGGRVAITIASQSDFYASKVPFVSGAKGLVSAELLQGQGWEIGVCVVESKQGEWGFSFRSRKEIYNVQLVAREFPVGGGHIQASGATLKMDSKEEVMRYLLTAIKKSLPFLGDY